MQKVFKVTTVNNITDISSFFGLKTNYLKKFIENKYTLHDNRYLNYQQTIKLLDILKLQYKLDAQLTVIDDIKHKHIQDKYENNITIGIIGHINHGKTTLIKKITNYKILEDYEITQNLSVYSHKHYFFIDTPGHGLFHNLRHHILKIIDIVFLVIAMDENIAHETKQIINMLISHSFDTSKIVIILTKHDIAKYTLTQIKEEVEKLGLFVLEYVIINYKKPIIEQIKTLTKYKHEYIEYNYVLTIKRHNNKEYNLIKINNGTINKKTCLLFQNCIYRITNIYNLQYKPIVRATAYTFIYCCTDKHIDDIDDITFVHTDDTKQVEAHNKYIIGQKFLSAFHNKQQIIANIKKQIICIVDDIILIATIKQLATKHNVIHIMNIIFRLNKYLLDTITEQKIILFKITEEKSIETLLQQKQLKYTAINNIYQLETLFKQNNSDILNNQTIKSLAKVVKIFVINKKQIVGCKMLFGTFKMNQKVKITSSDNQIHVDDISLTIVSMKQEEKFIKQTKQNIYFGIIFNSQHTLKENLYIYDN